MAEPFKEMVNRESISLLAKAISAASEEPFSQRKFVSKCMKGLSDMELLTRIRHVASCLADSLPGDFVRNAMLARRALPPPLGPLSQVTELTFLWPLAQWVQDAGLDHPEEALDLIYELTKRFSCEFAIRPYYDRHQTLTLKRVRKWTRDPNEHVRRLCSEGIRPKLPWGKQLKAFIEDPTPIFSVLDKLKDDESFYVRRSVANCLNDISKDHPTLVLATLNEWGKVPSAHRKWLIKHALRTLIKAGDTGALSLIGIGKPKLKGTSFALSKKRVRIGESFDLLLNLENDLKKSQELLIDYVVHFQTARGILSPKVFKWKRVTIRGSDTISLQKTHKMRVVTTRKFYTGAHKVEIQINGAIFGSADFVLTKARKVASK